jgi:hypothetical protein
VPSLQSKDNTDESIKLVLAQISYRGFEIVFEHISLGKTQFSEAMNATVR